jgi:hypothetical protein
MKDQALIDKMIQAYGPPNLGPSSHWESGMAAVLAVVRAEEQPQQSAPAIQDCYSCAGKGCILCDFTGHS